MSTTESNELNKLVKTLQSDNRILEIYTASGIFNTDTTYRIITGKNDAGEPTGRQETHETAPGNDVIVITLNGRLETAPGVSLDFPRNEKGA